MSRPPGMAGLIWYVPSPTSPGPNYMKPPTSWGMLVWQDLPIRGLMSRSVGIEARRQAREAIDLLGHHPSVSVWCAHDGAVRASQAPGSASASGERAGPVVEPGCARPQNCVG